MGQRNVKKLVSATTRTRTASTVYDGDWDSLYQTAPIALALFDSELRFIRVNERFAKTAGVAVMLLAGEYVRDIVPELAAALEPLLREVFETEKPILDREIHNSGERRCWLASFHPVKRGLQVFGVNCSLQEITGVNRNPPMLALIQHSVDHASDEIMWLDATGRFVYVNQTACQRLEYWLGELLQMNVREIVPDSPPERYSQVWARLHQSGSMSIESLHRAKSGRVFPVEVALNLVEFQGQEYCFAVVRDITERKEVEAREQRALKRAKRLQSTLLEIATDQDLWSGGMAEAVRRITEIVAGALEVRRASVWLLDQPGKAMRALDVFDRQEDSHTSGQFVSLESIPDYLKATSQGRVVTATDVFKDPWTASMGEQYFRPLDISSVINAPVRVAGKVPAILAVAHTGSIHEWTQEEINFVAEVADQVAQAMLNAERQRTEQVIQRLTKDVVNKTGHEFFRSIASSLGEVLEADIAFVAEVLPDQTHMRSLAMWVDGQEVPNILDDLTGTPCANVVSGSGCSYPSKVQERFPSDSTLVQAEAQAYFGTPLFSSTGKTFGLLAVLFRRSVENVGLVEAGLAAFAARAAAEMERLQNEDDLRRKEERYRAFIANAQESIWRLEFEPPVPVDLLEEELVERMMESGYLAEANDFGAKLRGWSGGASEIVGMRLPDLVLHEHFKTDALRMLIRNNFRFPTGVFPLTRRDGSLQYVYRTGTPVIENGLLRRIWGTGLDMTDLVLAQEEVRKLNATLEEQVRNRTTALQATVEELQAFSHSVSHDLRAPLLGMAGCSRALLEDYSETLEPAALDWIKLIQRDAEHMDRLLTSLLALARITQTEIVREPLGLTAMAKSVVSVLRQSEPDRKVEVAIAEDIRGFGDPALLRVVMENLIGNAWKFSKTRPDARIEVGVTQVGNLPAYFVRDNGVGFDPQYSSRLFGAFQRLHAGDFEGTGIGLATVRRIIHRHGGRVWAEGAVNQGATFYFTLDQPEESRA